MWLLKNNKLRLNGLINREKLGFLMHDNVAMDVIMAEKLRKIGEYKLNWVLSLDSFKMQIFVFM